MTRLAVSLLWPNASVFALSLSFSMLYSTQSATNLTCRCCRIIYGALSACTESYYQFDLLIRCHRLHSKVTCYLQSILRCLSNQSNPVTGSHLPINYLQLSFLILPRHLCQSIVVCHCEARISSGASLSSRWLIGG